MEDLGNLLTLIWIFPILFMFHDFEEIIMCEKWVQQNKAKIYQVLPNKMANRIVKQFSMTTAQFSVAVLVIFIFVSLSTILASQYVLNKSFGDIYFFTTVQLVFFLHAFTHIGQSILLRSITPGAITSIVVIIPYSLLLFPALFRYEIITWQTIWISLPLTILIVPILLSAHWIGKKVV
nr:HXXEE domain-containing protein [Lysinibacillus timonensis]